SLADLETDIVDGRAQSVMLREILNANHLQSLLRCYNFLKTIVFAHGTRNKKSQATNPERTRRHQYCYCEFVQV
ncbi:MAG: hypothetical protein WAO20_09760, partial [Acidobacteriota bacterium]